MKKTLIFIIAPIVISIIFFVSAHSQEDMEYVDSSVFPSPQRAASVFKHDEHNELAEIEECNECHHVYEDGEKLEDESSEDSYCYECHDLESDGTTPGLRTAFHMNCKGCHQEKGKGPILCGECHIR